MDDSAKNSSHLEDRDGRAADIFYTGISKEELLKAKEKTGFSHFSDSYSDGHTHLGLPNKPEFNPGTTRRKK